MNAVQTKVLLATLATLAAMGGFAATWYVDAVNGNDTTGGTSVTDARRTLTGAMSISELKDDDTVLALPGVYGDESVEDASKMQTRCRITKARRPFFFAEGSGFVGDKLAVKAEFSFALMEKSNVF